MRFKWLKARRDEARRAYRGVGIVVLPGELASLVLALVELLDQRQVLVHLVRQRHDQLVRLAAPRAVMEDLDVHHLRCTYQKSSVTLRTRKCVGLAGRHTRVQLALAAHLLLELGVQVLGHLEVLEHALELVDIVSRHAAILHERKNRDAL